MRFLRIRRRYLLILGLAVVLGAAAYPSYRWWNEYRTEQFLTACQSAQTADDWLKLEQTARDWLVHDPRSGDAWLFLATAAQQLDDPELAADCLGKIPGDHPKCVASLIQRIDLLMEQDRAFEAEATALRALEIEPGVTKAHTFLIFFAAMTLRRHEMVQRIYDSIEKRCESPDAYVYLVTSSSLKFSNGYILNDRWSKKDPDSETFKVAKAVFLATSTDSEAIFEPNQTLGGDDEEIVKQLKAYPDNLEIRAFYLQKYVSDGVVDKVAGMLEGAPDSALKDSRFWRAKGWYHLQIDELKQAEFSLSTAVAKDPYDWRAWHLLSTAFRRQDRPVDAASAANFAAAGKFLEREILKLPKTNAITDETLHQIADYARRSSDQRVFRALQFRLGDKPGGNGLLDGTRQNGILGL